MHAKHPHCRKGGGGVAVLKVSAEENSLISSSHLSLNREGRWGTTDVFATSFRHFSLFSTALWDLANISQTSVRMLD